MRFLIAAACLLTGAIAMAADNMKAFPPAEAGMMRYVINLPAQDNEDDFKVELQVGKTVKLDAANRYFFSGKLEKETIQGWGYDRYLLRELGPMGGTLMAVDPNAPKVDRFIMLGGEPSLLRYNSRLPLVVYVPEGVEVRYRIWRADSTATVAEKG
jgi:ecotin